MDDRQIALLAKGLVPFVREVIAEATAPLAARLAALEQRTPEKGEKGEPGIDGKDGVAGRDGRDAADLALLQRHIDERVADGLAEVFKAAVVTTPDFFRTVHVTLGDKTHELKTAIPLDYGVWAEGTYAAGDGVTLGGSFFIAQTETSAKPGKSDDWRLAVKRGVDGRDWRPDDKRAAEPVRFR